MSENKRSRVFVLLRGYPRITETFVAQEILGLKRMGLKLSLAAMRYPSKFREHPVNRELAEVPIYLPEKLRAEPSRLFRAWRSSRKLPGYHAAKMRFLADLRRDPTFGRLRRFAEAMVLAAEMPADTGLIYVHFLHSPTSVARYASHMRELPFAISAHARDIWTIPDWDKRDKLAECRWIVTCTGANAEHLRTLAPDPSRVALIYHGLDFSRFPRRDDASDFDAKANGSALMPPVRFLSVGRLVEKKGYESLFDAFGMLPEDLNWRLDIVGGGALQAKLFERAKILGFETRVSFIGAMPQDELLKLYRSADAFVLNCRIADDGDRDGLPNVLMEAQSQRLFCVSTAVSAVPELIVDEETGLLVPPNDTQALAKALARAITDPSLRKRLAAAGEARVFENFGYANGVNDIFKRITATLADQHTSIALSLHGKANQIGLGRNRDEI